jgi:hypothetical protein
MIEPNIPSVSGLMATYQRYSPQAAKIKEGALWVIRQGAFSLRGFYTIGGLMSLAKAISIDLHVLTLIPLVNQLFDKASCDKARHAFNNYKELNYATQIFVGLPDYLNKDRTGFQLPRTRDGGLDYLKICFTVGGFFDQESYLKKYKVWTSPPLTGLTTSMASIKVFNYSLRDVPLVQRLGDSPKEFFFLIGSGIEVWRWCREVYMPEGDSEQERAENRRKQFSWENILKVSMSAGRVVALACYRNCGDEWWFILIQFIVQNAAPVKHDLTNRRLHAERQIREGIKV